MKSESAGGQMVRLIGGPYDNSTVRAQANTIYVPVVRDTSLYAVEVYEQKDRRSFVHVGTKPTWRVGA